MAEKDDKSAFYTLKGYALTEEAHITAAMEDYLEMIMRLSREDSVVRITRLAERLNVRPSSASKMVANLKNWGLVDNVPYGMITLTEKGRETGEYLLMRHEVLSRFLCYINGSDNELAQVEKLEHFFERQTILNISKFLDRVGG